MNIDSAIMTLEDLISGADEDRGRDARISEVIQVLKQHQGQQVYQIGGRAYKIVSGELVPEAAA